jgi:DNA modification methylase
MESGGGLLISRSSSSDRAEARRRLGTLPRNTILVGDAQEQLRRLPDASVDCCITSIPYYNVRDYGVRRQIGLEADVDAWVGAMRPVFDELARVMKAGASAWINVDDTYSSSRRLGVPAKGMFLAPERLILALSSDGWIVRSKVVWSKPNPLPRALSDRPNHSYEMFFMIVRSPKYEFDLNGIRVPYRKEGSGEVHQVPWSSADALEGAPGALLGKDPGDVWSIPAKGFSGGHFATFPESLIERPLIASCPERLCMRCDKPWHRQAKPHIIGQRVTGPSTGHVARFAGRWRTFRTLGPLKPSCACKAAWKPGVVIDPFFGAGTTGIVAERLRRDWIGIELNPRYANIARERLEDERERQSATAHLRGVAA